MKTPRQILFERHGSAQPNLDALRESVVATVGNRRPSEPSRSTAPGRLSLREFILSFRWQLTGLGAAWVVILLLNLDHSSSPVAGVARENIPAPNQLLASLQAYSQQLVEMLERPAAEPAAAPPRRSQFRPPWEVV